MAKRQFHWSPVHDCVMHETDGSGNTLVEYTHEPAPYGPLISEHRNGQEYVHHYDALGSTTMLTDETESVTDTFSYDAWGNEVARTGTTETPYRWVGRWGYQYDEPTESYYVRARIYQPTIARWASMDPLDNTWNQPHNYAVNNPVRYSDPSGLEAAAIAPCSGASCCSGYYPGATSGPQVSDEHCGFFSWIAGNCCTATQIAIGSGCCESKEEVLDGCHWSKEGILCGAFIFSCKKKKKWKCTTKARNWAVGTPCYGQIFDGIGSTEADAKSAANQACWNAGCHAPGHGGDCGHPTCIQLP